MGIDYKDIAEWEVETPSGWKSFSGIKRVDKNKYVEITFESGQSFICSIGHKFKRKDGKLVDTKSVRKGTSIISKNGTFQKISSKKLVDEDIKLFDLIEVEDGHVYFTDELVSSNCAFIEGIEDIWLSAQYTLSTGGRSVILSTPAGVGNFFHKTWVEAEQGDNNFNTIRLPWHLHPDRDQEWRDKQTKLSGEKGAAQECDCSFETSGDQVIHTSLLTYQKDNFVCEPLEKRGLSKDLLIWKYVDYDRSYIVSADCARGDGNDFSAFHVFDIETLEQVAEFKSKVKTKEYGNLLISIATEYNNALLVVENSNIGWATIQEIIDRGYENLFYNEMDVNIVEVDRQYTNKLNALQKKSVPGFSTSMKNRPLMISKMESYFREKSIIIRSERLYEELLVFIWNGTKAEAMKGYNDDLVMSLAICLWIRDTALRLRDKQKDYNKNMLTNIKRSSTTSIKNMNERESAMNSWSMPRGIGTDSKREDLTWLL
jgi:hypothetical protein